MREPYPAPPPPSLCLPPPSARSSPREIAGAGEDVVEHRLRESSGEGVLLAGVVAAEDGEPVDGHLEAVPEPRTRAWQLVSAGAEHSPRGFVREATEHDDHREPREQVQLADEEREAAVPLFRERLVARRCAANRGRDVRVVEAKSVAGVPRRGLVGEPRAVERGEQPVTRAIAGEHPA